MFCILTHQILAARDTVMTLAMIMGHCQVRTPYTVHMIKPEIKTVYIKKEMETVFLDFQTKIACGMNAAVVKHAATVAITSAKVMVFAVFV